MLTGADILGEDWLATGALADACRYAVAQTGKQLRSRLVREASRLGDCEDPRVHSASRAVELLHIASLAHDDVIDNSPLRRGNASLERKHGGSAAACTGGWLFGTAAELAAGFDDHAISLFAQTTCELCDGEMREALELYDSKRRVDNYLVTITGKTASLFSLAAQLGGIAGGAPRAACTELGRYGRTLGVAFQIADDILDLLSDRDGNKRQGDDVRHGVFTLPVMYALEEDPALADNLTDEVDDEAFAELVIAVRATGAYSRASATCNEYGNAARELADALQAPWLQTFVDDALAPLRSIRAA